MTEIWAEAVKSYNDLMSQADHRVDGWFLMDSPLPTLILTIGYAVLVEYVLPKYMEHRKPFCLRRFMLAYNFAMVALSGYIFMEFGLSGWFTTYTLGCELTDYSRSPQAMRMLSVCYWFYFSKLIEFVDTFIFCLRKKNSQVTFLHVVHHGIMPFSWYWGVKFGGGGMGTFHALLNSFIHFLMYIYYGLAGLGPQYQKYLWWKKYMTKMQMLQFTMVLFHSGQLFFTDCQYPKYFNNVIFSYAAFFLILFANFYVQAYLHKGDKAKAHKSNGKTSGNGVSYTNGEVKVD